jgi:penicillin-binding protein 1C
LGDGEVNLLSLTTAYTTLADSGILAPPKYFLGSDLLSQKPQSFPRNRFLSPEAAFLVSDILSDDRARQLGFGFNGVLNTPYPSSVKTGTSSNFRDNWCIGYTDKYVVGVWAGNFAAQPMTKISGVTGAGTLWRKSMDILAGRTPPKKITPPSGIKSIPVCPISGLPSGPFCPNTLNEYFLSKIPLPPQCDHNSMSEVPVLGVRRDFRILAPLPREIYAYDPGLPPEQQRLRALVQSVPGVSEVVWVLNGEELARTSTQGYNRASFFLPLVKGRNQLELMGLREDGEPLRAETSFTVK